MSYLSIDEVLSEEDRLPVTFEVDVDKMGYLDPTSASEHLLAGSRIGKYVCVIKCCGAEIANGAVVSFDNIW
jgi:hypothetical protein